MEKLPPYNNYWVIPDNFMAGEYPGSDHTPLITERRLDALLESGITTFIDLTEPNERVHYEPVLRERAGYYQIEVVYRRFSIGDFGVPSKDRMKAILNTLHSTLATGGKPYVHCWAGMGRTGTVVGCFLAETGLSGADALLKVDRLCYYAPSPQTEAQKDLVRNWR